MIDRLRKFPYRKTLAAAAGTLLLYTALGFWAAPGLIERGIPRYVAENLQRQASVGHVRVNPLLFKVEIRDFALKEADGEPIVGFERLLVDFELSSLVRWAWTFSEITLEGLDLHADIRPDGVLNLAALAESFPKGEGPPAYHPPRLVLQHIAFIRGAFTFSDRSGPVPASASLRPIDLEMKDISTLPDQSGAHSVRARLPGGGTLSWHGEKSLRPVTSRGELTLKGVRPAPIWKFVQTRLNMPEPAGELDLAVRYQFSYADGATRLALTEARLEAREITVRLGESNRTARAAVGVAAFEAGFAAELDAQGSRVQVLVRDLALKLTRVSAGEVGAREPIVSLDSITLDGGSVDFNQRRIAIRRVAVTGGAAHVIREQDGKLRLVEIFGAGEQAKAQPAAADGARKPETEEPGWSASLDALGVSGVRVALADRSFDPVVAYDLENIRIGLKDLRTDGTTPVGFEASLQVKQGGKMRASGSVGIDGSRAAGKVSIERVSLKPLQPAVARHSTLRLESGEISAAAKLEYRAGKSRPELRVTGRAALDNLLLNESASGERLLSWRSFAAEGVTFGLAPDRLHVAEARLIEPGAKIVVFKDRSLNLVQVLKTQPATESKAPTAAITDVPRPEPVRTSSGGTGGPEATATPFAISVDRVRVENGVVDFADLALVLPFAAKVEEFQGSATGISSDAASGAALKLEGRVGEFGLARVDGTLKPFQPKTYTDIGVVFRNVEMLPLSPYTATFAGRRIASGRLALDLRYKIENSQLAGDNKVAMEKFTLGERVDAPGALNLPYDLAIALLTDADGRIDIAVPVTGNVDDPQFSYGHLIWQAIATVIKNIVTAPFRALAALFGGSAENLESIAFDAGRATMQPPEREKLKRVADALGKRPQLRLVVEGQVGEADIAALRERAVANAVALKLGRSAAAGALPEPVNPLDAKTQRTLEVLFAERNSGEALSKFVAETEKARGKPVQRVNPALALVGRASADIAFYETLLKRLNDTARIPDTALGQLADARARAVAEYLVQSLSVPAARVAPKAASAPGARRVKLEFDVLRPPAAPQVGYLGLSQGR